MSSRFDLALALTLLLWRCTAGETNWLFPTLTLKVTASNPLSLYISVFGRPPAPVIPSEAKDLVLHPL